MKKKPQLIMMITSGKTITLETGTYEELEAKRVFDEVPIEDVDFFDIEKLEEITQKLKSMGGKLQS